MHNFENAFNTVCELVNDFKENEHRYLSPQYQEAEVRRDYIDKLFEALGWDVYHRTQRNPYEQEVKVEKGVSVGKAQKRADYAFYISPEFRQPKFFCEAKKPCRSLKNADDYFQTIRYGWNASTPVAVLTDFEEFHVLDCRYKPKLNSVLENPNHKRYSCTDYTNPEKFKEIYFLFSRDSVAKSSLEKYSDSFPKGKIKGKTSFKSTIQAIDDDFLEYIDEVRETLAKAFKKNDLKLSSEELTEATQRTIDRIVFIRFLEDKLIEPEYYISEFGKKRNPWTEFISVCRKLDAKYNGIVFKKHFIDEQNFQGPEQSTFKKICDEMSYLNSPYDFNAIPIHILGSIYERFLGKVVNATAQRVKVEEKPEVRKAGGVYYTPKYIVDYIVENTVGKILRNEETSSVSSPLVSFSLSSPLALGGDLIQSIKDQNNKDQQNNDKNISQDTLPDGEVGRQEHAGMTRVEGKTPAQIAKLRFADIACGSGSFLIGVFETLLKYHTEYYQAHPEEAKKDGCINKDGQWILSIKQKQNILLNNIYGVDIDNQAVEVTQLSLALKMLEDESTATANEMQVLFHEKILPDLSKNIVCGNSLIGTDILLGKMFPTEEERKLNPMDFEKRFPKIMRNGGFDAIVGNPPYLRIQGLQENFDNQINYYIENYKSAVKRFDIYLLFIEKGFKLLKNKAILGYICPHKFLNSAFGSGIREMLIRNTALKTIINFGHNLVFEEASTYTGLIFLSKENNERFKYYEFTENYKSELNNKLNNLSNDNFSIYDINKLNSSAWVLMSSSSKTILDKINMPLTISNIFENIMVGIQSGIDEVHILKFIGNGENNLIKLYSEKLNKEITIEVDLVKPLVMGDNVKRYQIPFYNNYVIYPYKIVNDKTIIMQEDELSTKYPLGYSYLREFKKELFDIRERQKTNSKYWYSCHRSRDMNIFEQERIVTPYASLGCNMTISPAGLYHNTKVYSLIPNEDRKENKYYWLALFNSKIMWYFMKNTGYVLRGGYYTFTTDYLSPFPVKTIDFSIIEEKEKHDLLVSQVGQMFEAKKQLQNAKTDRDKTYYENKCEDLDRAIDSEVYKLYGLTEEEIKIVEGK